MRVSLGVATPVISVEAPQPLIGVQVVSPEMGVTSVTPVYSARLDELNSFLLNEDGTVHRDLYCTPTYFQEDYVVKPNYA